MAGDHQHTCGSASAPVGACCNAAGLQAFYQRAARGMVSRRHVMAGLGTAAVGAWALTSRLAKAEGEATATQPTITPAKELIVQPVLTFSIPKRAEQTSWRPWGGLMQQSDVDEEAKRITGELADVASNAGLAVKFLPVALVDSKAKSEQVVKTVCDVMLIYAAGGDRDVLEKLVVANRPTIFFLRHRSGPVSLWYEIMHPHFLRKTTDEYKQPGVDVNDVVVDQYGDLVWRLRGLLGLRRTLGQKVVTIGGAAGWGIGGQLAPKIAQTVWKLELPNVSYDELGQRIKKLKADSGAVAEAAGKAENYLKDPNVELQTDKKYVANAFLLARLFKDLMAERSATAITVNNCMGTIMPMAETTACLTLSLLNDEGYLAFCESDFVVIPSGILMHHITGLPVFLNDPTWPHHGIVTVAHCTAPRKMNGDTLEPVKILTHFESDYGAAPKVEMAHGHRMTMVAPDFASQKWVGFTGNIVANPFHAICRAQMDVTIDGNWPKLLEEMRGFHWMMVYGDCAREIGYAIKHLGIKWLNVSAEPTPEMA